MQNDNSQKIVNILEAAKEDQDEQSLPDLEKMLCNIQAIPQDLLDEYFLMIDDHIDDLLTIKQVINTKDNLRLFQHVTANLTETQLYRLKYICDDLASKDLLSKLRNIGRMTFGSTKGAPESYVKACEFLKMLKALNINFADKSKELADLSNHFQIISEIFWLLDADKNAFTDLLISKLADNYDENIDYLISLANAALIVEKNASN